MATLYDHRGNKIVRRRMSPSKPQRFASGYYEAVNLSRARSHEYYWGTADWRQTASKGVRDVLMSMARHLSSNSGEVRGLLKAMTYFSVGTGLQHQSLIADEGLANEYNDYFAEWSENAEFGSGKSFAEVQQLCSLAVDRDGDIGVAFVRGGKIQLFESQQIVSDSPDGNELDGIIFDRQGRPVAYNTRINDHLTGDVVERRHRASMFSLIFSPERVGQMRGISALAHGINDGIDFAELMGFAKLGLKQREAIGFVIQNEDGVADPLSDPTATFRDESFGEEPKNIEEPSEADLQFNFDVVKPGCVPRLRPNEKIEMLSDSRPSNTFGEFVDTLLARISGGMSIPLEIVWPSKRSPTGPAMRAILARGQTAFDTRANLIENLLCKRVWRWVMSQAILDGVMKSTEGWDRVKWGRPPKLSIDAGRDTADSLSELQAGTQTLEKDAEMRGMEWRSVREQREIEAVDALTRAQRLSDQFGIDISAALAMLTDTRAALDKLSGEQREDDASQD